MHMKFPSHSIKRAAFCAAFKLHYFNMNYELWTFSIEQGKTIEITVCPLIKDVYE